MGKGEPLARRRRDPRRPAVPAAARPLLLRGDRPRRLAARLDRGRPRRLDAAAVPPAGVGAQPVRLPRRRRAEVHRLRARRVVRAGVHDGRRRRLRRALPVAAAGLLHQERPPPRRRLRRRRRRAVPDGRPPFTQRARRNQLRRVALQVRTARHSSHPSERRASSKWQRSRCRTRRSTALVRAYLLHHTYEKTLDALDAATLKGRAANGVPAAAATAAASAPAPPRRRRRLGLRLRRRRDRGRRRRGEDEDGDRRRSRRRGRGGDRERDRRRAREREREKVLGGDIGGAIALSDELFPGLLTAQPTVRRRRRRQGRRRRRQISLPPLPPPTYAQEHLHAYQEDGRVAATTRACCGTWSRCWVRAHIPPPPPVQLRIASSPTLPPQVVADALSRRWRQRPRRQPGVRDR